MREGLYRILGKAFSLSGIPWVGCHIEDRGDGAFILAPPDVPKALFVESLPGHMVSALREHNIVHSTPARIRLRMALHAGEMHLDNYGATGASINLAFRLLDARELKSALARTPGVLALIVSSWFFDEVVRNNPASSPSSYRKVQLSVKETDTTAWIALPDGRETPTVPRQLPAASRFVGRGAQLDRLTALLDTGTGKPLCVISGTAGAGKTALAVCWAYQVADRFPDGQLYADLNGFGPHPPAEPGQVLYDFLHALGVDPSAIPLTAAAQSALYRSLLAQRRMLVLLDNAASPEQVRPLLPGDGQSAIIVTSRDRLVGLAAWADVEHMALDVLDTAEALEILARRIGRGRVDGERQAAAALTELCAGLPLALTITAARIAARPQLSLHQLVEQLTDERTRMDALALAATSLDLRSVFSYSYQQLHDQPARLFRLLGLLPGQDIDIRAAAALAGTDLAATERSIDELLATHLLDEGPRGRFRMHDLLRVYARELAEEEADPRGPLIRLFDYYLSAADQADRFITPHRHRVPLEISRMDDTDPVVHGYAEAVDWLTAEKGNLVALCRLAERGFESRCWQLAYTLRGFCYLSKRWDAWIQTHEYALAACLRSGDRRAEAMTRNNLGRALLESGRQDEAAAHYAEARRLFEEIGDQHGLSNSLANQATIAHRQGDLDEALRLNDRALQYYREVGARRNTAITLRSISRIEAELGRLADAVRHAQEALDIFVGLDLYLETAKGFTNLGRIHQRRSDISLAENAYQQALDFSYRCGSRYEEARALHCLGGIAAARGARDEAHSQWRRAYDLYRSLGAAKADQVAADLSTLDRTAGPQSEPS